MDYRLLIVLILLVTIYGLYYTNINTNWTIALGLLAMFVLNELIKDKEFFSVSEEAILSNMTGMRDLQVKQHNDIEHLEDQLDLIQNVLREKHHKYTTRRYPSIQVKNSCVIFNADGSDAPNNTENGTYDHTTDITN